MSSDIDILYILPGDTRSKDRVVPLDNILKIEHYNPSRDLSLTEDDRKCRPNGIKVTVKGEGTLVYPFILPCNFRPEWSSLETAARELGVDLHIGDPIKDEDAIGRSVLRSWFAAADGCVYTAVRPSGGNMLIAQEWPCRLDSGWIEEKTKHLKLASKFTWSGTSELSVAVLANGDKVAVRFGAGGDEIEIQSVFERLEKGEQGDDLPIVMNAFGVDYDAACDAVFNEKIEEATRLLRNAVVACAKDVGGDIAAINSENVHDRPRV